MSERRRAPSGRLRAVPFRARPGTGFLASFVHAWAGLIHTVAHARNMRVHVTAALLVSLVGSGIPLGLAEKVTLIFCVLIVFFAEVLNSALEHLVDLAVEEVHPKAKLTKDAAAAGVFILAIGTVVIFAAVLFHNAATVATLWRDVVRQTVVGAPLTACAVLPVFSRRRRPALHIVSLAASLVAWAALVPSSKSAVFSAMTFGLIVVCIAAWRERMQSVAVAR